MGVASVGQVYQFTFVGTWCGQTILSTFRFALSTMVGSPTTSAITSGGWTAMAQTGQLRDSFVACCPNTYQLANVYAQAIAPVRYMRDVYAVGLSGTNMMAGNTANVAGVIQRRGGLANKHNLGSLHVPMPNGDTGMANGVISSAYKALLTTLSTKVLASWTDVSGNVLSPILFPNKTTDITKAVPITAVAVQTTVRTMRARTVGHGK